MSHVIPYLSKLLLRLDGIVETENADVLLTGTLLRLDQASGTINADDQASSNLGIESTTVTSLLDTKDATDPGDDLVRGRVGGLVQVDDTISVCGEICCSRSIAVGWWIGCK